MPDDVVRWLRRRREDEPSRLPEPVAGPAHLVPQPGDERPFIQQHGVGPSEKRERPLRCVAPRVLIFVEQYLTGGELLACCGLAATAGALD